MSNVPRQDYTQAIAEYYNNASVQELAKKYGLTRVGMIDVLARHGITDRSDHDCRVKLNADEAINLYEQGMSAKSISKKFKCSEGAIFYALRKMGISTRKERQATEIVSPIPMEISIPEIKPRELKATFSDFQKDFTKEVMEEDYVPAFMRFDDIYNIEEEENVDEWLGIASEEFADLDY